MPTVSEDKAAQVDSRLRSLNAPTSSAVQAQRTATQPASRPRSGYGLLSLFLVAILAFIIGHLTQSAMPELVQTFHHLKSKYLK